MKQNAELLLEAERLFLPQKSKCTYLKQADGYTKFFHDLIKRNNKRKAIVAGTMTTDTSDIVEEFVQFYRNLLGSKLDRHIIDGNIINEGPCISVDDFEGLTNMVTMNEMRDALFDIANDKSPGSDDCVHYSLNLLRILFMTMSLQLCTVL